MHCLENGKQIESFFYAFNAPRKIIQLQLKAAANGEKSQFRQWFDVAWMCRITFKAIVSVCVCARAECSVCKWHADGNGVTKEHFMNKSVSI